MSFYVTQTSQSLNDLYRQSPSESTSVDFDEFVAVLCERGLHKAEMLTRIITEGRLAGTVATEWRFRNPEGKLICALESFPDEKGFLGIVYVEDEESAASNILERAWLDHGLSFYLIDTYRPPEA